MKKKLLFVTATSLIAMSLTSCQLLFDLLDQGGGAASEKFSQVVASSKEPIIDVSTPPAGDLEPIQASKTYRDFISNNLYPLSATPTTGTANLLVIPVWFKDSNTFIDESKKENVREDIQNAYFGDASSTGWNSVKSYYETESLGALTLTGTVSVWYESNKNYSYYGTDEPTDVSSAPKTTALVEEATEWYFANHTSESRSDYDCDKDGYLDGVMVIYAAPDYGTLGNENYDNLWAYCYWVQDYSAQNVSNPGVNAFFWASYNFMYGKEVATSRTGKKYSSGDTSHCTIDAHTYIHEMGHMFGLEDYYDYSSHSYSPAGGFSMQDYNVGGHDPFSSFAFGWGKAYIPTETINIDLKPFSTSGEMILLSPNWNSYDSAFDEYILLEYYTDLGLNELDSTYGYMSQYGKSYPMGTKTYGIRVWHVDARLLYTTSGSFSASKITTNPNMGSGRVVLMMSNTYPDGSEITDAYISPLGTSYGNYNLLQLIRNKTGNTTKTKELFGSSALFTKGDTFSMSKYSKQFVNAGKLNSNTDLDFEFTVNACNSTYASISVKKL